MGVLNISDSGRDFFGCCARAGGKIGGRLMTAIALVGEMG